VLLTARFKPTLRYAQSVTQRTVRESTQINNSQMRSIACDVGRFEHDMRPADLHIYTIVALPACEQDLALTRVSPSKACAPLWQRPGLVTTVGRCQWTRKVSAERSVTTVCMIIFAE
jgi:hypothetical protein